MVTETRYTSIRRVLDNLTEHPMLRDLTLEQVVRHTIRFISLNGFPRLYTDGMAEVDIEDFRGVLPCDLVSITQVRDKESKIALRAMTDTFYPPGCRRKEQRCCEDQTDNIHHEGTPHGEGLRLHVRKRPQEMTFKTQGRMIYTSFPKGRVEIMYKSIPVDDDGYPLLMDNETYLAALEAYIKKQVFTIKFDLGKISAGVLQNAQQDYAWYAGMLDAEMHTPSVSEMESISRMWNTLIPQVRHFDTTFKDLGNREYIRKHR